MAEWQLRDYRIDAAHFGDFVGAWRNGVLPLLRAAGFEVLAWTIEAESRFIRLLGYVGPGTFEDADRAYYASPARAGIHPDPAQWIVEQRVAMVERVPGAP